LCNDRLESFATDMYEYGILSLYNNQGSFQLATDILTGRLQYVILKQRVYGVAIISDDAITELSNITDASSFKDLNERRLIALFSLQSTTPGCRIVLASPFNNNVQTLTQNTSTTNNSNKVDLVTELGLTGNTEPIHVLGYTI